MPKAYAQETPLDGEKARGALAPTTAEKSPAPRRARGDARRAPKDSTSSSARRRRSSSSSSDLGWRLVVLFGVLGGIFLLAGMWTPWTGPRGAAWASSLVKTMGGSVLVPLFYGLYLGTAFLCHRTVERPWAQIGGTGALTFSLMIILGLQSFGLYRLPFSWAGAGQWGSALAAFLYRNLGAFGTVLTALGALLVAVMCYGTFGPLFAWFEERRQRPRPDSDTLRPISGTEETGVTETLWGSSNDPRGELSQDVTVSSPLPSGPPPDHCPGAAMGEEYPQAQVLPAPPQEEKVLRRSRQKKPFGSSEQGAPLGTSFQEDVPVAFSEVSLPPSEKASVLCPEGEAVMRPDVMVDAGDEDGFAIPLDVEPGKFPAPLETLGPSDTEPDHAPAQELLSQGLRIISTLKEFNIEASLAETVTGPTVVQFRLQLAPGIKVSKISGLSNDLAVALTVPSLRVEAPIPGKPYVGIEIPNPDRRSVSLRSLIGAEAFQSTRAVLPLPLGVTIDGRPLVLPLEEMPHLLVAGTTGSGKSVFISSCLIGLTHLRRPEEVRLILIDPKQVEMALYEKLPHTLTAPVTDPKKALNAFNWAIQEMERRYALFAQARVRHLRLYNSKVLPKDMLPHIVIVVDELADLMMTAPKEVEDAICRLAQKARATGIHLILATQRPSVNVVTGLIKANVPARIAFTLPSQVDSRTIIDVAGAERLLGRGDMLLLTPRFPKPIRCQAAWIEEQHILAYIDYLTKIFGEPDHLDITSKEGGEGGNGDLCQDPLLEEAIQTVLETGMASSSGLQRRFRVGYTRAARMIDAMEALGIVGPQTSRGREILVDEQRAEELLQEARTG